MHSEPAIENRANPGGRRRKCGNGPVEGPVFVDNSGRRSRLLKRFGLLVGVLCLGYAVVLGLAFLGIGTSVTPSSLLPFRGGQAGPSGNGPAGYRQQGGIGNRIGARPSDIPSVPPSGTPTPTASATAAN